MARARCLVLALVPSSLLLVVGGASTDRQAAPAASGGDAGVVVLSGHRRGVWDLCFLDGHTLASASADGTVRLWDVRSRAETRRFEHGVLLRRVVHARDAAVIATLDKEGQVR